MQAAYNGQIYSVPLKTTVRTMISRIRSDIFTKECNNDDQAYLRKSFILWATDETLPLLRYNGPVHIDATFCVVPATFVQCRIVMVYDKGTDLYVPATYSPQTSKCEEMYCAILRELVVLTKYS
ncbi:hypothetical protein HZS_4165 [Henneguya salminicola]|nr:hypothetical protein HZS_4165 [Henneguya salminicola]